MKTIKFKFTVSTRYVGSEVEEEIDIDFDDDATEEEIEKEVKERWVDWRNENSDGGWFRIEDK